MPGLTMEMEVGTQPTSSIESIDSICLAKGDDKDCECAGSPACRFLLVEMLSALYKMGYNTEKELLKVAGRISGNLHSATWPIEDQDTNMIPSVVLDALLEDGRINSNEPVLLVNVSQRLVRGRDQVRSIKMRLLTDLRQRGIRPVRVYVRAEVEADADAHMVLLNVANTDIGGPGMVQLLDAAFHDVGWKQKLLSKEAWHGEELLWHDEVDEVSELRVASRDIVSGHSDKQSSSCVTTNHDDVPELSEAQSAVSGQRNEEPSGPYMEHPTWRRGDKDTTTLLDIVTSQSLSLTQRDVSITSVISGSHEQEDDEFEFVDAARLSS